MQCRLANKPTFWCFRQRVLTDVGSLGWEPAACVLAAATVDPFVSRRQGGRRARKSPRAAPRAQRRSSRARPRRRGPTRPESTAQLGNAEAVWLAPWSLTTCRRDPRAAGPPRLSFPPPLRPVPSTTLCFCFAFGLGECRGLKTAVVSRAVYFGKHLGPLIDNVHGLKTAPAFPENSTR